MIMKIQEIGKSENNMDSKFFLFIIYFLLSLNI